MLGKITDFFRNLPSKKCAECGKRLKSSMSVMEISAMTV